ncbi:MarR family winged helix-turn-helix transcriptional regulator [Muricoccus aerilatus]|uniref:MarR family winged helix-turn-helix transcriptional regulator n=1 Tax=Muricoccus aerilatus TaxID=452982 RepID=UPI001FE0F95C|nr:MarR family transcriptional regulator [Roseomonas aerilata]
MTQPLPASPAPAAQPRPRRGAAPALRVLEGAPAERGGVRLGPLTDTIGFHLRLAQEASFAAFARRNAGSDGAGSGLKPGRFAILAMIRENPGLSQTALGLAVGRDKSTLTPALAELERCGLVRRDRGADRRSYALSLTPAGEAALTALSRHAEAHDRALDRLVGAEHRAAFLDTLRRLIAGLDTDAQ